MNNEILSKSIAEYQEQLAQVETALIKSENHEDTENLLKLRDDIQQLITLTVESLQHSMSSIQPSIKCEDKKKTHITNDQFADEYALFMAEINKEGAVNFKSEETVSNIADELKSIEGMKCRAPHKHNWGDVMYHNAIVCSVVDSLETNFNAIEVKVMFINPTHQEMLPCPFLLETECKFSDDKCKYSHGEVVNFSSLQEYEEPKFELLDIGSKVLAKQSNKLWNSATIKKLYGQKCTVRYDVNGKDNELELHDVLPLQGDTNKEDLNEADGNSDYEEDIINLSLVNELSTNRLGEWEKHTKGIGMKLMQQMGYVIGTGLGRKGEGRIEPVDAVVLPPGKSLDHCMNLREKAGGDKDLFSVERQLKRLQRKQEKQNEKAYEREKKKTNIFNFINDTLSKPKSSQMSIIKSKHRKEIKGETSRDLNVASLQIEETIKKLEREMEKIRGSLIRHRDVNSQLHKTLQSKLVQKQTEIKCLKAKASNITLEQNIRTDKKKLTIF